MSDNLKANYFSFHKSPPLHLLADARIRKGGCLDTTPYRAIGRWQEFANSAEYRIF
jgi:hypothetical protein